jgi:hypothetical protein
LQAINEELASLYENDTWTVEHVPHGVKPIPCKWVFKVKKDAQLVILRDTRQGLLPRVFSKLLVLIMTQ